MIQLEQKHTMNLSLEIVFTAYEMLAAIDALEDCTLRNQSCYSFRRDAL
jgi:hypothetical protein